MPRFGFWRFINFQYLLWSLTMFVLKCYQWWIFTFRFNFAIQFLLQNPIEKLETLNSILATSWKRWLPAPLVYNNRPKRTSCLLHGSMWFISYTVRGAILQLFARYIRPNPNPYKQDWKAVQRCASKTDHLPILINTKHTITDLELFC